MKTPSQLCHDTVNRLAQWRTILTGWQLGTRSSEDPEAQAVRDHREAALLQRAEITALTALLHKKGLITVEEFELHLANEAEHLMKALERKFPGAKAVDDGMSIDTAQAFPWMSKFPK